MFGARFCIWSTAPGVMLHEFSHALLCVVFRHRITDFALFSPQKNGNLGWVAHKWNPRSLWQNIGCFFIGVAPIAFGVAAIVFLTLLLLPAESLPFPPLPGSGLEAFRFQFRTTFLALCRFWIEPDLLLRWRSWLWLYAVFAIGSQITLSRADLAGAGSGNRRARNRARPARPYRSRRCCRRGLRCRRRRSAAPRRSADSCSICCCFSGC